MKLISWLALVVLLLTGFAFAEAEEDVPDDRALLSYYDDSVFFGDSITGMFASHIKKLQRKDDWLLDRARFFSTVGISLYSASRIAVYGEVNHFTFHGGPMSMYDIAYQTKAKKVFILLGMNDPIALRINRGIGWVKKIIRTMTKKVPGVQVHFFSVTPVISEYAEEYHQPRFQEKQDEYNRRLKEACEENGAFYIEIAEALKDADNYLKAEYANGKGTIHLSPEGMDVWVQCLKDFALEQYRLGLWSPETLDFH